MRITVGHVVIIGLLGTGGYFSLRGNDHQFTFGSDIKAWVNDVRSWTGVRKRGQDYKNVLNTPDSEVPAKESVPSIPSTVHLQPTTTVPGSISSEKPLNAVVQSVGQVQKSVPQQAVSIVNSAPVTVPTSETKISAQKEYPKRAKTTKKKAHRRVVSGGGIQLTNAVEPTEEATSEVTEEKKVVHHSKSTKPSAKNDPVDKLVGSLVTLDLKSGQKIQGVLVEKSATHYKIELPGMGPFLYPVENVTAVNSAQ